MQSSWEYGFKIARRASLMAIAPRKNYQMGSALINGKNVVSTGYNIYGKTHPEYTDKEDDTLLDFCRNIHAEMMALAKRRHHSVNNLTMYTYRELADGTPAESTPCLICRKVMKQFGVKRIRYIDQEGSFMEEKL
jgi:deoxycytidylate deaminase